MPGSRRDFFKKVAGITLAASTLPFLQPDSSREVHAAAGKLGDQSPLASATDEDFWFSVRSAFNLSPQLDNDIKTTHQLLARFADCSTEEILITRNTTRVTQYRHYGTRPESG